MALDYIIGGLQLLSAAVNVLALGAFWISPGLRATANRFVINLLVANIIACLALTPGLWLHGGLKTRFHMDSSSSNSIEPTAELFQASNVKFQAEFLNSNDELARSAETTTVKTLHHHHHHHHSSREKRDVEQPDYMDTDQFPISHKKVQESLESVVIERDERGNIRKFSEKQVVDIQNGDEKDEIHIFEEIAAEPMAVVSEAVDANEPVATIKHSSTAHRIHTVYTENSLVFDCTRFWGFDFAAAVGKPIQLIINHFRCHVTLFIL